MSRNLLQLRLDTYLAENKDVDISSRKYLGKWKYKMHFRGDVPKRAVSSFAQAIGAGIQWGYEIGPTIYFDDRMIEIMARSVVAHTELRRVQSRTEALSADAGWEARAAYRILFDPFCRPCPQELANRIEDDDARLIVESHGFAFGDSPRPERVVAVLTNSDETMALIKHAYPATRVQERCPFIKPSAASTTSARMPG